MVPVGRRPFGFEASPERGKSTQRYTVSSAVKGHAKVACDPRQGKHITCYFFVALRRTDSRTDCRGENVLIAEERRTVRDCRSN